MALVAPVENGKIIKNSSSAEETKSNGNDLGYDQFLQLLCAEMQYQDPLEPTSNTEYVAQLATFSQMESMLNMQNTMERSSANELVGKYVIVNATSSVTGETTAIDGFVDFIHYENGKQYMSINGSLYSVDDLYEIVDPEYMEAVSLADAFAATVSNLPDVEDLTIAWQEDVENLEAVYNGLNSYQQSYISKDTLTKHRELVAQMKILVAISSSGSDDSESMDTSDNIGDDTGTTA
jgi:flagellar basal-body rod modification protein FlgD